ncbi:MAG: GspH/FimT family pseudopilin [Gammaproteobacteria bacterium]|nr:GspH/FimT family pseudopilin [Gammaproteobacteria bacterium]MDH5593296.1 GspH/FimT family pseudopilin [Gammaproteobacteria bacterium]
MEHIARQGRRRTSSYFLSGFTLPEMITALAVASIVTTTAIPAMQGMVQNNRMTTQVNTLVTSLHLARSEAVKRNQRITLCQSTDGITCGTTNDWHNGWIMFTDLNHDHVLDPNETLIRIQQKLEGNTTIKLRRGGRNSNHYMFYEPTGFTDTNGRFTFCDLTEHAKKRGIIYYRTGRPRLTYTGTASNPLDCT